MSGLAAAVGFLVAGVAVAAAGKAWDDSPAGQDGALARTARAVAEASVQVPAVVIVDDADWLDEGLAVTLIENLAARHDGHVLVVAAVDPGSSLQQALVSRARQGITEGLVHVADATRTWAMSPAWTWSGSCARTCPMPRCGGSAVPRRRSRTCSRSRPRPGSPRSPPTDGGRGAAARGGGRGRQRPAAPA